MYEQVAHSLLNDILDELKPELRRSDLRHFYTRLGANFYAIHSLFMHLYGDRDDAAAQLAELVEVMAARCIERPAELETRDRERERNHAWFLGQEWVGMALYADGFAGNLAGVTERLSYLQELGVNLVHVMPMLECPAGASDGGYAVSDFKRIDPRIGSLEDFDAMAASMRQRDMLLTVDVVANHTSNEHAWAEKARAGEPDYRDFYFVFEGRELPDLFEQDMPEIFPETAPGNFTWDDDLNAWVMTVFNEFQWDLNYANPRVFREMLDVILFWANRGADVIRLDAVAFLWKKIGTTCQNQREAHLLLQLLKDCCQVTAPGVVFIAEAIVAPLEIIKYFGEDAVIAKECEIAYNATLMALLWDAVATRNARLLNRGIQSLPSKLDRATWLNYVRCHDDIGLGFDDADIEQAGYGPHEHRRFLLDYFSGRFEGSNARGQLFGANSKTGDARISGTLASLVGLEAALEHQDPEATESALRLVELLHAIVLSFGGIPLLNYGDELGTLNDYGYLEVPGKRADNRWMHRPRIDWTRAERRHEAGTVEHRVFNRLRHLIEIRKLTPAFADYNNRELLEVENPALFVYLRSHPELGGNPVLVVANFSATPQRMDLGNLGLGWAFRLGRVLDLATGQAPTMFANQLALPPFGYCWLTQGPDVGALPITRA